MNARRGGSARSDGVVQCILVLDPTGCRDSVWLLSSLDLLSHML